MTTKTPLDFKEEHGERERQIKMSALEIESVWRPPGATWKCWMGLLAHVP